MNMKWCSSKTQNGNQLRFQSKFAYPYPKEISNLKCVLEKNEMDQEESDLRPIKPEMLIRRFNHKVTFYGYMFFSNFMSKLCYDMLQFRSHGKEKLRTIQNQRLTNNISTIYYNISSPNALKRLSRVRCMQMQPYPCKNKQVIFDWLRINSKCTWYVKSKNLVHEM